MPKKAPIRGEPCELKMKRGQQRKTLYIATGSRYLLVNFRPLFIKFLEEDGVEEDGVRL